MQNGQEVGGHPKKDSKEAVGLCSHDRSSVSYARGQGWAQEELGFAFCCLVISQGDGQRRNITRISCCGHTGLADMCWGGQTGRSGSSEHVC